jgi:cytoplasmic iron level regulating protein YaaA (DUF328/UPF0246 family)
MMKATFPMNGYAILLPPSEGKAPGGTDPRAWPDIAGDPALNAFPALDPQRAELIAALRRTLASQPEPALRKIFGVKGAALAAAVETNRRLPAGPLLPAIERYTGVMFDYMSYATLPDEARRAFDTHVILFSGLWGLLRPADRIPDYKLKMDARLPGIGAVARFWKPAISRTLDELLGGRVVWDLLPGAHGKAWDGKAKMAACWQVKFVERVEKDGETRYRTVSHWSKALKGALVRFICENDVTDPAALADFEHPQGYRYRPELSKTSAEGGLLFFAKE